MSAQASDVEIKNLVWGNLTTISSVTMLSGGGADIYMEDEDGDELNLELDEEAAKALRNELLALYPIEDEEEETAAVTPPGAPW